MVVFMQKSTPKNGGEERMKVIQMPSRDGWFNYSYAVVGQNQKAWCVDPWDGVEVFHHLSQQSITVEAIINTHRHPDHIRGNEDLARLSGAPILSREALLNQTLIPLDNHTTIEVKAASGHTMDHLVFLLWERGRITGVVSGDMLFNFGVGNCRNGGNVAALFRTVRDLDKILPDDCVLYPGHDYMETNLGFAMTNGIEAASRFMSEFEEWVGKNTTMGLERQLNPFLRVQTLEEFSALRLLRDQW